jgi:hypothetical protein
MGVVPGLSVKIVVETDHRRRDILVMDSMVYEVSGDTLVLTQTTPPIDSRVCGGEITVTYLVEEKDGPARYGFPAAITSYLDDYQAVPGRQVQALLVSRKADPASYSVRTCYRVVPTPMSRLDLYVCDEKATIADISLGGVRFGHDRSIPLEAGVPVKLRFYVAGEEYTVDATLLRTSYGKGRLRFAVAEFKRATGRFEQALARRIYAIERTARREKTLADAEEGDV